MSLLFFMACLNLLSCNVRGVSTIAKRDVIGPVLSKWNVVFVQESFVCNQRKAEVGVQTNISRYLEVRL